MTRKGRDLEKLVALLEEHLGPEGIQVTSPDYILGKESQSRREVDISLRSKIGSVSILVIVECRDREGSEDVTWIEQLASKRKDVGANKAIAVSSTGFTLGARNLALANDVELRTVEEVNPDEILLWFGFREITGFNYGVNFDHVSIQLATSEQVELPSDFLERLKPKFDTNAPVFRKKKDGTPATFMDIWACVSREEIYSGLTPDVGRIKRQVHIDFSSDLERFQIPTTSGIVDIAYIDVYAQLWIQVEKKPLTAVRVYRDEKDTIAQSAEFEFEHLGRKLVLDLHQYPQSGNQFVSIRPIEDGPAVNLNIMFTNVNDVIREHLLAVARKGETITYSEIAALVHLDLEIESNRDALRKALGAISREEHKEGRPLLSVIVVSDENGRPGDEFFVLARTLGHHSESDNSAFFAEELRRTHEYWHNNGPIAMCP